MSTSGQYTYTVSRDTLIRNALINTGKIGGTQYIAPQHMLDVAVKLNLLVRQWMGTQDFAPGLKMWSRQRADLFLSMTKRSYLLGPTGDQWAQGVAAFASTPGKNFAQSQLTVKYTSGNTLTVGTTNITNITVGDYLVLEVDSGDIFTTTATAVNTGTGVVTLAAAPPTTSAAGSYLWNYTTKGQRPLELTTCILRDINNNDTPMDYLTVQTYEMLPTKAMTTYVGDPTAIYYEPSIQPITQGSVTAPCGVLRLDVGGAADVTKHLNVIYLRPLQSFVNPLDTPDFSEEWQLALEWGLTKQICPMFNALWDQTMEGNLQEALAIARNTNAETTEMYFQANADRP